MSETKETKKTQEKCAWPECKTNPERVQPVQVIQETEKGLQPTKESIGLPMCKYHSIISSNIPVGGIKRENQEGFGFYAPVEAVKMTEIVISAMALSGHLKNLLNIKISEEEKRE